MRIVGEIPHSHAKITIFSWNGKYLVKFEFGGFEQVYKIPETEVNGVEELKKAITPDFIEKVGVRFREMANDFASTIKTHII